MCRVNEPGQERPESIHSVKCKFNTVIGTLTLLKKKKKQWSRPFKTLSFVMPHMFLFSFFFFFISSDLQSLKCSAFFFY